MSAVPTTRILPSVRGLPRAYWVLWSGALVNRLGSFVVPFLTLYLTSERGLSVERAGAIVSLAGVGSTFAAPVGGWLADRIGRRATLLLALVLGSLAMMHLGLARAPAHIAIATLLQGFLGDMYRPAVQAGIADVVQPEDRTRAYGFLYWAVNLGWAVSMTLAGLVARSGYLWLFLGDAGTTLVFAFIVWRYVPESRPPQGPASSRPRLPLLTPLGDGVFVSFCLLSLALSLIFQQCMVGLPLDLRAHGVDERHFGAIIATNGVLIVLLQPFAVAAVERTRRRGVLLAIGALLVGGGFWMNVLGATPSLAVASVAVWTLGEVITSPVNSSVVADLAPTHMRGVYQGVFAMSFGVSTMIAPTLGTWVLGHHGASVLWRACAVTGALIAAGHLVIAPYRRRRLA